MNQKNILNFFLGMLWVTNLLFLLSFLVLNGYADVDAGGLALAAVAVGIILSAKGMALLKRLDDLSDAQLESGYRYRNGGIALGLTGSGLLVLSWETFLARFINTAPSAV